MTAEQALQHAVEAARTSPCAKSKRGVVVFHPVTGRWAAASNGPPSPFVCDGSVACRAGCRDVAVHAEARAILATFARYRMPTLRSYHLLHDQGLKSYSSEELHALSLRHHGLPGTRE